MKLILYMVMSADGVVAKDAVTDIRAWSSPEDRIFFLRQVAACDAAIMGRRSYNPEVISGKTYLLTHDPTACAADTGVQSLSGSAREIYARIEADGSQTTALLGGPETNHAFLKENLVDEMFLTIEPVLLGTGLHLSARELDSRWMLTETIPLNQTGTVVMHYRKRAEASASGSDHSEKRWRSILCHPLFLETMDRIEQEERNRTFCKHDLSHFLDTARILYAMILEGNYPCSMDLVYGAGLLHDIGRCMEYTKGIPHEIAAEPIARSILAQCGYTEPETIEIIRAISAHGENESSASGTLGQLLYQADKTSRPCYRCPAAEDCYWPEERKRNTLSY